jgi:hypothetical protein
VLVQPGFGFGDWHRPGGLEAIEGARAAGGRSREGTAGDDEARARPRTHRPGSGPRGPTPRASASCARRCITSSRSWGPTPHARWRGEALARPPARHAPAARGDVSTTLAPRC